MAKITIKELESLTISDAGRILPVFACAAVVAVGGRAAGVSAI